MNDYCISMLDGYTASMASKDAVVTPVGVTGIGLLPSTRGESRSLAAFFMPGSLYGGPGGEPQGSPVPLRGCPVRPTCLGLPPRLVSWTAVDATAPTEAIMATHKRARITAGCLAITNSKIYPFNNGKIVRVESSAPSHQEIEVDGLVYGAIEEKRWIVASLGTKFTHEGSTDRTQRSPYLDQSLIPIGPERDPDVKKVRAVKPKKVAA